MKCGGQSNLCATRNMEADMQSSLRRGATEGGGDGGGGGCLPGAGTAEAGDLGVVEGGNSEVVDLVGKGLWEPHYRTPFPC